jgi:serine/threonine protein kinase
VKLAVSQETGDLVAIKIVSKSSYSSVAAQAIRLNTYSRLHHPNILKLYEWFECVLEDSVALLANG